jgi:hypothetical protein
MRIAGEEEEKKGAQGEGRVVVAVSDSRRGERRGIPPFADFVRDAGVFFVMMGSLEICGHGAQRCWTPTRLTPKVARRSRSRCAGCRRNAGATKLVGGAVEDLGDLLDFF